MRILVSGGGSGEEVTEQNALFANLLNKSKPLLYLPLAIDTNKHPLSECLDWLKSDFDKLGINKYDMIDNWKKASEYSLKNPEDFAGVYIGGGNTPYLLEKLKEAGFWEFLKRAIEKNVPIFGGSAGAIIFAKSIIPCLYTDMNWNSLKNFEALNCIDCWEISCHYKLEDEIKVKDMIKKYKLPKLIALTNKNGLYICDKEIKLVGQEPAKIFLGDGSEKELPVGERL